MSTSTDTTALAGFQIFPTSAPRISETYGFASQKFGPHKKTLQFDLLVHAFDIFCPFVPEFGMNSEMM